MSTPRADRIFNAVMGVASLAIAVVGVVMTTGADGLRQAGGLGVLALAGLTLGVVATRWQSTTLERRWVEAKRQRRSTPRRPAGARTR